MNQQMYGRPTFEPSVYSPEVAPEQPAPVPDAGVIPVSYGGDFTVKSQRPEVRLARKMDEARAEARQVKRDVSNAALPIIQKDYEESTRHMQALQAQLEQTRRALETPFDRPAMDQADMLAAGIAGLFGGAQGFNQAASGAYQRSDQDYAQNFQMQRQNAMMDYEAAQNEVETARRKTESLRAAYINAVQKGDEFAQDLLLTEIKSAQENEAAARDHANRMEVLTYTQEQLNKRANLNDPRQRELAKRLAQTEEGAAALGELLGLDAQTIAALKAETPQAAQIRANTNLTNVKAEDILATRPARLKKLDADVQRVLSGIALDQERMRQIAQKIAMYPDEFKLRAANVYSQIAKRESGGGGKAEKYPGEGSETTFRQMRDISAKVIAPLTTKMMNGEQLTPEEAQMYAHHSAELKRFQDLLDKTIQAKANYHTGKAGGAKKPKYQFIED